MILSLVERKSANYKLKNEPKYVVVGHSHPECAFNDSIIPDLQNLSQSGESYFYTYFKIKPILIQNPSIKVVFVEYTNNQINKDKDKWIWGNQYMSNRYPKYSSFMTPPDNLLLFKNNTSGFINSFSLSIRKKSHRIFSNKLDNSKRIGGYLYLKENITDSIINTIDSESDTKLKIERQISEVNLAYLDSIIKICERNNKKVVLIRSPQHQKYSGYENEETYKKLLHSRYKKIEYIDFSKVPLHNSEFADLEHLNYKGARIFSTLFASLLNKDFLESQNKKSYIDEIIKDIE